MKVPPHQHNMKQVSSKVVYKNQWITVREDEIIRMDGTRGIYGVVDTSHSVMIVAVDSAGCVYLEKQFRYPTQQESWEVPGGGNEHGDDLLLTAKRELSEEVGIVASAWTKLGTFQSWNGISSELFDLFLAQGLSDDCVAHQNEDGILEVKKVPFAEALAMVRSGDISDAQTITALMIAGLHLELF